MSCSVIFFAKAWQSWCRFSAAVDRCRCKWHDLEWISSLLCSKIKQQVSRGAPVCGASQDMRAYLNERVDDSHVRTGVEHFVEVRLSVDELQLVELFVVLEERVVLADSQSGCGGFRGVWRRTIAHLMSSVWRLFQVAHTLDTTVSCLCENCDSHNRTPLQLNFAPASYLLCTAA